MVVSKFNLATPNAAAPAGTVLFTSYPTDQDITQVVLPNSTWDQLVLVAQHQEMAVLIVAVVVVVLVLAAVLDLHYIQILQPLDTLYGHLKR